MLLKDLNYIRIVEEGEIPKISGEGEGVGVTQQPVHSWPLTALAID